VATKVDMGMMFQETGCDGMEWNKKIKNFSNYSEMQIWKFLESGVPQPCTLENLLRKDYDVYNST